MGMGEPMHNLPNVIAAIRRIADRTTGSLGWRQITVSTVGIVPGIDALALADLNVHLAVSLHAPDDATRSRLVPMNNRWAVADVMAAARRFEEQTGRIPTIEYCLLDGVNNSDEQAGLLAGLMRGFRAHVNLIAYNTIGASLSGVVYRRPTDQSVERFLQLLRDAGVVAHVRRTRGDDVNAACAGSWRALAAAWRAIKREQEWAQFSLVAWPSRPCVSAIAKNHGWEARATVKSSYSSRDWIPRWTSSKTGTGTGG